ncbi:hypothetical protein [Subtercola lobariae]|uniref:Uncharacterized protein n=1 Tax=Subtercola lobariae TaxID=1588641 RepID=A0A917EZ59_9MICO|nr:hypothetical protein [Subtercola lobariae]GGF27602.1 hypothetical protein GCM10011399_21140 [Subtercola lobariae]
MSNTRHNQSGSKISSGQRKNSQTGGSTQHTALEDGRRGGWGAFAGLITFVLIAFPLSTTIAFATHPATQTLFGSHLADASQFGYRAFWWILSLMLLALPFLVGYGLSNLGGRGIKIAGAVVALFVIVVVVLGQLFVY